MRRVTTTLALALCLLGCGSAAPPDIPISADVIGNTCPAEKFLEGLLIVDRKLGIAIQDDRGVITPVLWSMRHSIRWSPGWLVGGEFEVLDGSGTVVATTGRRYKIGGQIAEWAGDRFWACADVFIPQ